ncbi:MAG: hypothetical protein KJ747_00470 [Actinobacteria bacterium]|nr:hypothetical protein [Actinomycetota bacterium]
MRLICTLSLVALLFTAGCTAAPIESANTSEQPIADRSQDATYTLKGWLVPNESVRFAHPSIARPVGTVGYFAVSVTGDDPAGDLGTENVYATSATKFDIEFDPFDRQADAGNWLWIDVRNIDGEPVATRVYAPVGIAR